MMMRMRMPRMDMIVSMAGRRIPGARTLIIVERFRGVRVPPGGRRGVRQRNAKNQCESHEFGKHTLPFRGTRKGLLDRTLYPREPQHCVLFG